MSRGKEVIFWKGRLEGDRRAKLQSGIEVRVTCEVRTFGELTCDCLFSSEVYIKRSEKTFQCSENHFNALCDGNIGPLVDMIFSLP